MRGVFRSAGAVVLALLGCWARAEPPCADRAPAVRLPLAGFLDMAAPPAGASRWQIGVDGNGFEAWRGMAAPIGVKRALVVHASDLERARRHLDRAEKMGLEPSVAVAVPRPGPDGGFGGVAESCAKRAAEVRRIAPGVPLMLFLPHVPRAGEASAFAKALKAAGADREFEAILMDVPQPHEMKNVWPVRDAFRAELPGLAFRTGGSRSAPAAWQDLDGFGRQEWTEGKQAKRLLRNALLELSRFNAAILPSPGDRQDWCGGLVAVEDGTPRPRLAYRAAAHAVRVFSDAFECVPLRRAGVEMAGHGYAQAMFRRESDGVPLLAWWRRPFPGEGPTDVADDAIGTTTVRMSGSPMREPVCIDILSGCVYAVPESHVRREGGTTAYLNLPAWDSPVVLTERRAVAVRPVRRGAEREADPLDTPWTAKAARGETWQSYPRPQLVRKGWTNLNGQWDYAVTDLAAARPSAWQGKIRVPFPVESALSGVRHELEPDEILWYRRMFTAKRSRDGARTLLHFGGVDYRTQIFVNGIEATAVPHAGGILPFSVDMTDFLKDGENELVVGVWDPTDDPSGGGQATGKQTLSAFYDCFYRRSSGIWQTVWMETVPCVHITGYRVDGDRLDGTVTVTVGTSGVCGGDVRVMDGGREVVRRSVMDLTQPLTVLIPDVRLWSPESPHLYDLEISVRTPGGIGDRVKGYFGVRRVEVKADVHGVPKIFLNGKPYYMHGLLDHGWWPDGLLAPPAEEGLAFEVDFCKRAGFNTIRKHTKVEPLWYYRYCDEKGVLVWQDMPGGRLRNATEEYRNARYGELRRDLKEMVDALRPFPCVVAWVAFNEAWGQPRAGRTNETLAWLKRYDPSRLVDGPSGWDDYGVGDMRDVHTYPSPSMVPVTDLNGRASVCGEYGAVQLRLAGHVGIARQDGIPPAGSAEESAARDAAFARYRGLMAETEKLIGQGLAASIYTRNVDAERGFGGLLTYDRKIVKFPVDKLADCHGRLYRKAQENAK